MRRSTRTHSQAEPGQDSFLDIVANLVGILIILVMVVGARARDAMVDARNQDSPAVVDVDTPRDVVRAVQGEIVEVSRQLDQQALEAAYRRKERDKTLMLITAAERALQTRRDELDEQRREAFDQQQEILAAQRELEDLKQQREVVANASAPVTVLRHIPTPLAQTVFGAEVHFRLSDGRLTYIPLQELVEKYKTDARQNLYRLKDSATFTDIVGPIRGFRLKYTLKRAAFSVETRYGAAVQQRVELDHFVLLPVAEDLGEPFAAALQPGSEFQAMLSGYRPQETTVTIWVYPDDYGRFRQLRELLVQQGFATASRPMPAGRPISGSPHGTRSAAQ